MASRRQGPGSRKTNLHVANHKWQPCLEMLVQMQPSANQLCHLHTGGGVTVLANVHTCSSYCLHLRVR
jgi:hypothetical protein